MHPLDEKQVDYYLQNNFAFVGAYLDNALVGIVCSKRLEKDYPFFTLPKKETAGDIYSLGGLYINNKYVGQGLAKSLSDIIVKGTQNFANNSNNIVGMAFEVSYDNPGSLSVLSNYGNFIGYYIDKFKEEGLSLLLYKAFNHKTEPINLEVVLDRDEDFSKQNLDAVLSQASAHENIGGLSEYKKEFENGNLLTTVELDYSVDTNFNFSWGGGVEKEA